MNSIARTDAYNDMAISSLVMGANSHELVQLLFTEVERSLEAAKFFLDQGDLKNMRKSLTKTCRILGGLQGGIDFDKGGEIAINLSELYRFCIKELFKVNTDPDEAGIANVKTILSPIFQAWAEMPASNHKN